MQALLDSLVIETYTQLAVVVAVLAALATASVPLLRRQRAHRAHASRLIGPQRAAATATPRPDRPAPPVRTAKGMDFDRLAGMIADASDRAGHISETQSAAALKLDTAEMAVNRLIAEIDPLMAASKTARPQGAEVPAPIAPRSIIAA